MFYPKGEFFNKINCKGEKTMSKRLIIFSVTLLLMFIFLFNVAYGNPLLEVIPEKVIAILELKDAELIKNIPELNLGFFSPEREEGNKVKDYKISREEIKEELGFDVLIHYF
jgi:hypothetical protein